MMLFRIIMLAILLLPVAACTVTEPPPPTAAILVTIPTPPATAVSVPTFPVLLPNEANRWVTYTDAKHQFSLALPRQWYIIPPEAHANQAVLTAANYDMALTDHDCPWPDSLVRLTFTGWVPLSDQTTLDWIGDQLGNIQALETVMNGRYPAYLVTTDENQELIVRITPSLIVQIQVTPASGWHLTDAAGILNSLAAPDETIIVPAVRPTAPVVVPGFCQEAVSLYAGPGDHFQQIGSLRTGESLSLIGRSHDGLWLKLLYPATADGLAWAKVSETITTAGKPPIEPVPMQPGNS